MKMATEQAICHTISINQVILHESVRMSPIDRDIRMVESLYDSVVKNGNMLLDQPVDIT